MGSSSLLIECSQTLLRLYKHDQKINENVIELLTVCKIDTSTIKKIFSVGLLNVISDIIWRKNGWKNFALFSLRLLEVIMSTEEGLRAAKQTPISLTLVASIRHLAIEEDYQDFEE